MASIVLGLLAGIVCLFAVVKLKSALGYDDSLDVFGVHCVGGILGAILTGVFNNPELGGYGIWDYVTDTGSYAGTGKQVVAQLWGVGITLVWSGLVALIAYKLVDWTIGLRVSDDVEREGLDTTLHGERAYD
jgi:Amt family ammonium transporter